MTGYTGPSRSATTDPGLLCEEEPVAADVLVVDDDVDIRWAAAEVLRAAGYSVSEAGDGDIAFDLLTRSRYGMVLLDIRLPNRDGVALVEEVGEVPPVVVHSAYVVGVEQRARLGARVVGHLQKPVPPQTLVRAVEAVIGTRGQP